MQDFLTKLRCTSRALRTEPQGKSLLEFQTVSLHLGRWTADFCISGCTETGKRTSTVSLRGAAILSNCGTTTPNFRWKHPVGSFCFTPRPSNPVFMHARWPATRPQTRSNYC